MSKNPLGKLQQRSNRAAPAGEGAAVSPGAEVEANQARGAETAAPARRANTPTAEAGSKVHGKRRRGSSDVVSMTVRVRREDWARLVEIRSTEGKSGQEVFFEGLKAVFAQYGFPPPEAP